MKVLVPLILLDFEDELFEDKSSLTPVNTRDCLLPGF
jgi:hypothetical protein